MGVIQNIIIIKTMTYNTGAKKMKAYCPRCLCEVVSMVCPKCDSYVFESDSLTLEEVKKLKNAKN